MQLKSSAAFPSHAPVLSGCFYTTPDGQSSFLFSDGMTKHVDFHHGSLLIVLPSHVTPQDTGM